MNDKPELLSIQDLFEPDETTENLLETLSTEQLNTIQNALSKIKQRKQQQQTVSSSNNHETSKQSSQEPTTEIKEGVEWVSFVYSHHRTLRRYCIRTDLDKVDTQLLDEKFKKENCVYPRANLPKESYRGNRWSYETECNDLGWKLAWLNHDEIAGKRGLIQRAVDSYRNRYPSMRSRRVARQEKLLKGTLRKRKNNNNNEHPKVLLLDEVVGSSQHKCRLRINIESVSLDAIDLEFRKANCVFPRAIHITQDTPNVSQRRLDEAQCNEIGWKLAWLNPRPLANRKNMLQRALDTFRAQFMPDLKPRKYAIRQPSCRPLPLTEQTLAAQQQKESNPCRRRDSCYSGSTITLDFHDYCFSPPPEEDTEMTFQEQQQPDCSCSTSSSSDESNMVSSYHNSPTSLLTLTELYEQASLLAQLTQDTKGSNLFLDRQPDMMDEAENNSMLLL